MASNANSTAVRIGTNGTASPALVLSDNGQLPDDFLRLPTSGATAASAGNSQPVVPQQQVPASVRSGAHSLDQVAADEQFARALQAAEINVPAAAHPQPMYAYAPQVPPTTMVQRLRVTIYQAKLQKNYGLLNMDPYCKIRFGNSVYATDTAESGGKNPTWNRTISCTYHAGIDAMYIEIYDEGTFSEDERIAWAHIDLPEQALRGNRVIDWYPLNGKQGDGKEGVIQIAMQLESVPAVVPTRYYHAPTYAGGYYVAPGTVPVVIPPGMPYYTGPPQYTPAVAAQGARPAVPNPAPQPARVTVSDDDVAQLKDMFSNIEASVIRNVLESARGNKEEAINGLLQLASDATPVQAQTRAAELLD